MTQNVKLGLLDENYKIKHYDGIVLSVSNTFACLFLFVILISLGVSYTLAIIIFLFSLFILHNLIRKSMPDWIRGKNIVGELIFNIDSIQINTKGDEKTIKLIGVEQIEILSNYYQGYSMGSKDITHNGLASISIQLEKDKKASFKFVIKNKKEFDKMIALLKIWYKINLPIHEFSTEYELKSFLLQCNLKYAEIQKLKAEIYNAS